MVKNILSGYSQNEKPNFFYRSYHLRTFPSPLAIASKNANFDIVLQLIMAKADVNHVDLFGYTPLMYASELDKDQGADIVELLL